MVDRQNDCEFVALCFQITQPAQEPKDTAEKINASFERGRNSQANVDRLVIVFILFLVVKNLRFFLGANLKSDAPSWRLSETFCAHSISSSVSKGSARLKNEFANLHN